MALGVVVFDPGECSNLISGCFPCCERWFNTRTKTPAPAPGPFIVLSFRSSKCCDLSVDKTWSNDTVNQALQRGQQLSKASKCRPKNSSYWQLISGSREVEALMLLIERRFEKETRFTYLLCIEPSRASAGWRRKRMGVINCGSLPPCTSPWDSGENALGRVNCLKMENIESRHLTATSTSSTTIPIRGGRCK